VNQSNERTKKEDQGERYDVAFAVYALRSYFTKV